LKEKDSLVHVYIIFVPLYHLPGVINYFSFIATGILDIKQEISRKKIQSDSPVQ